MLDKDGTNLPSEDDTHTLLESIKEAKNDDIDHSDASLQEKHRVTSFNEDLQQILEQIYRQHKADLQIKSRLFYIVPFFVTN